PQKDWSKPIKLIKSKNAIEISATITSALILIFGILLAVLKLKKENNQKRKNALFFTLLISLTTFSLFTIIGEELNVRFFIILIFLPFVFVGLIFEYLLNLLANKKNLYKIFLSAIFLTLLIGLNLYKYSRVYDLENYQEKDSAYGGISLKESRQISEFIYSTSQKYPDRTPHTFSFEFKKSIDYYNEKSGISAKTFSQNDINEHPLVFLVAEKKSAAKEIEKKVNQFNLLEQKSIGRFIIFSLIPKKETHKIGFITDIHGRLQKKYVDGFNFVTSNTLAFFNSQMNEKFKPGLVIQCGDLIEGTRRKGQKSIDDFNALMQIFKKLEMPFYNVIGNHELRGLDQQEWINLTGHENSYFYIDQEDLRVIVLDGNDDEDELSYYVSEKQLQWLEDVLRQGDAFRKIVFIHYPVVSKNIAPGDKAILADNAARLKNLFSEHGVLAVFSGHIEKLELNEENGVRYFVIPGLERSENKSVAWYDSFAEITIKSEVEVKFYYKKDREEKEYKTLAIPSEEFDKIIK
ncbi:MAG: hypothetical protein ACD_9C00072G0001, partial [uncultured bacterium]